MKNLKLIALLSLVAVGSSWAATYTVKSDKAGTKELQFNFFGGKALGCGPLLVKAKSKEQTVEGPGALCCLRNITYQEGKGNGQKARAWIPFFPKCGDRKITISKVLAKDEEGKKVKVLKIEVE